MNRNTVKQQSCPRFARALLLVLFVIKNNLVTSYRVDATILKRLLSPVKTNCKQLAKVLHKWRHIDDYQPVE
jgi:hypothetical protein